MAELRGRGMCSDKACRKGDGKLFEIERWDAAGKPLRTADGVKKSILCNLAAAHCEDSLRSFNAPLLSFFPFDASSVLRQRPQEADRCPQPEMASCSTA